MPLDWNEDALAAGLRCYESGEYFEAHEHWEGVWLKCAEPDKTFLQALIQVSAAFHHLDRGNRVGTASLLRASLRRLENFPVEYGGVAVEELRASMRAWLAALDAAETRPQMALPKIR
jgi:predicted metal-dependent hydrolase